MKLFLGAMLCVSITVLALSANAQQSNDQKQQQRKGPPQEAFTACQSKAVNDVCIVSTPRGDMNGTCQMPKGDKLVCAPEGHGQRRQK